MRTLIVGAGAVGGYVGAKLIAAQRDVTFLVHEATESRLRARGLQIRKADGSATSTEVHTVIEPALRDHYDLIVLAVRAAAVGGAMENISAAVGDDTTIVPVVNGMAHLDALVERYGVQRVCGGAAQLAVSLIDDGVIDEVRPGAAMQIGSLHEPPPATVAAIARELSVDGLQTTVCDDIVSAMWSKFAFITSAAVLTCLLRDVIGPIAATPRGGLVAGSIIDEVADVAAAEGHPLVAQARTQLSDALRDPESRFAPSMYRDFVSGRLVEDDVLVDLAERARRHGLKTPLLAAALAVLGLHNENIAAHP